MKYNQFTGFYNRLNQMSRGLFIFVWLMVMFNMNVFAQWKNRSPYVLTADSTRNHKCGVPFILEAYSSANRELYEHLQFFKLTQNQYDSVHFSPSGRFKIFYNIDGTHRIPDYDRDQNGTPDYLEFVAKSFDRAWVVEVDSLGFNPPLDSSGNFREIYPVYCRLLRDYGLTILDYEIPSLPYLNFVTYSEINTNFYNVNYPGVSDPIVRDSMAIVITAAHEFNHAIQFGYRLWFENNAVPDMWFIESSATYMEEVVAKEVNDYIEYLGNYFEKANLPFDQSSGELADYGKVVLEIMLGERYRPQFVRHTWEEIRSQRALPALEKVLQSMHTGLSQEFRILSAWLYYTGERAVLDKYFPDAALFPNLEFNAVAPVQNGKSILSEDSLPRLSFQWYVSSVEEDVSLQLHLKATQGAVASDLTTTLVPSLGVEYLQFPASTTHRIDIAASQNVMPYGVVNTNLFSGSFYHFEMKSNLFTPVITSEVRVFPQPLKLSDSQQYLHFGNLPENASISVFNSQGLHLITLTGEQENRQIIWDLKNSHGRRVGSGVYLYVVTAPTGNHQGKFAVVY